MVKKIKFPLEMKNGAKARNIEELRENFDLKKIVNYFLDGRLLNWLNDRSYETEAHKISEVDVKSVDLFKKLCEIFEVEFKENDLNIENLKCKNDQMEEINEAIIKNESSILYNKEDFEQELELDDFNDEH